jgi:uncharacterized protein (DUF952 family)
VTPATGLIHHLVPAAEYAATPPGQPFVPAAYAADGFIHCTRQPAVLIEVANRFYRGVAGEFLVLDIDPRRLTAELRDEAPMPPAPPGSPMDGVLFPHIYGPLNREAIVAVRPVQRAADGRFLQV